MDLAWIWPGLTKGAACATMAGLLFVSVEKALSTRSRCFHIAFDKTFAFYNFGGELKVPVT